MLVVAAAAIVVAGCGQGDRLETYSIDGTVAFPDGKPLAGGDILISSEEHPVQARGKIAKDGSFTRLGTYEPGDGIVAGWHQVAIIPPYPEADLDETYVPPAIDTKYQNADRSGLRFEVKPDELRHVELTVTPPATSPSQ
jgi:hypothetical protein